MRTLREILQLTEETGMKVFGVSIYAQGVYAALTAGDLNAAEEFLDKTRRQLRPDRYLDYGHHFYLAAWIEMIRGNVRTSYEHIQIAFAMSVKGGVPFPLALNHIAMSLVLFELSEYRRAEKHLAEGRIIGRKMKSSILEFKCLIAGAYFALKRRQERKGLQLLRKALQEGKEKGFVNTDWWLPRVMSFLLARALEEGSRQGTLGSSFFAASWSPTHRRTISSTGPGRSGYSPSEAFRSSETARRSNIRARPRKSRSNCSGCSWPAAERT